MVHGDRAFRGRTANHGKNGSFDNWDCEKSNSELFCMSFSSVVNLIRGFNFVQACDHTIAEFFVLPMSDNTELNSISLTLVLLLIQNILL